MPDAPSAALGTTGDKALHAAQSDPLSAMAPRFNFFFRRFAGRFFSHFGIGDGTVRRLKQLEETGSVVYVMRYASRLDYFLFNALFVREGLRLSRFANGLRFFYYRPLLEALRIGWQALRTPEPDAQRARRQVGEVADRRGNHVEPPLPVQASASPVA